MAEEVAADTVTAAAAAEIAAEAAAADLRAELRHRCVNRLRGPSLSFR